METAYKAAFNDPRFPPLTEDEFAEVELSISILSPSKRLPIDSEQDLIQKLRPNIDGLILACDGHHGTFLPAMWESIPSATQFVKQLKLKMGLSENF